MQFGLSSSSLWSASLPIWKSLLYYNWTCCYLVQGSDHNSADDWPTWKPSCPEVGSCTDWRRLRSRTAHRRLPSFGRTRRGPRPQQSTEPARTGGWWRTSFSRPTLPPTDCHFDTFDVDKVGNFFPAGFSDQVSRTKLDPKSSWSGFFWLNVEKFCRKCETGSLKKPF